MRVNNGPQRIGLTALLPCLCAVSTVGTALSTMYTMETQGNQGVARDPDSPRAVTVWFAGILAFMVVIGPLIPGLPLAGLLMAYASPVRRSRWRMLVIWGVAVVYLLILVLALTAGTDLWPEWLILDSEDYGG